MKISDPTQDIYRFAISLDTFFESLIFTDHHPQEVSERIKKEQNIPEFYKDNFDRIVKRTLKAYEIVDFFKREYGINNEGRILEPGRLFSVVAQKDPTNELTARTYGFAIGFGKQKDLSKDKSFDGLCLISEEDILTDESDVSNILSRYQPMGRGVIFIVKGDTYSKHNLFRYTSDIRNGRKKLDKKLIKAVTMYHELRHVIEGIIRAKPLIEPIPCIEGPPELATGYIRGVKIDKEMEIEKRYEEIDRTDMIREGLIKVSLGTIISRKNVEDQEKRRENFEEEKATIEELAKGYRETIKQIPPNKRRVVSYILSLKGYELGTNVINQFNERNYFE